MLNPFVPELDADEYLRWEARQSAKFELHHGYVVALAGGTIDHGRIAKNVLVALDRLFPPPCEAFGSDVKVRAAVASFFYADAVVVCERGDPFATIIETPRVVAEVLSRSTRAYDLVEKRAAYRAIPSLEFYVIVHSTMRRIEVDARTPEGGWTTECADDGAAYLGTRALALDDIYARSSLERAEDDG